MDLHWIYGVVVLAASWGLAWVVYLARPHQPLNRILAVLLVVEGAGWAAPRLTRLFPDAASGLWGVETFCDVLAPWLYLLFLGVAVNSPLVRPLGSRRGRWIIVVLMGGSLASIFMFPLAFRTTTAYAWGHRVFFGFAAVVLLYALVATLDAYRRSPKGTALRRQSRMYAIAFGFRDVLVAPLLLTLAFRTRSSVLGDVHVWLNSWYDVGLDLYILPQTVFLALLGYAILKAQLFDIDLKVKWTISRGTVGALLIGTYFVVTQLAQNYLNQEYGWIYGAVASGLLLFASSPLLRISERVADAALPKVQPTTAYVAYRKLEVYRAAFEGGIEDGEINATERRMLERLRGTLGIDAQDAAAVEADARARFGAV